jgi:tetratricopeptide (TPR) repeat protein
MVLVRARELCERIGDTVKLMEALLALAHLRTLRGELKLARELAEGVLALAEKAEAPAMVAGAHSALSLALFAVGECEAAREHVERAIELFGPGPFRNFSEAYYAQLAAGLRSSLLLILGYPSAALANKRESIVAARRRSDPFSLFAALYSATLNEVLLRDSRTAAQHAEEMLSIATEHGMRLDFQQEALFFHGWAISATAPGNEGIAEMRQAISDTTLANPPMAATRLVTLAEACGSNGRTEEGLEAIAQGMALDETQSKGELNRVKGELLLKRDPADPAEAERCLRTAIDIASHQSARLLELRATTSLARLLQRQCKIDEARKMLAEIYTWFTEGFEFPDLKDAKALLDELSVSALP